MRPPDAIDDRSRGGGADDVAPDDASGVVSDGLICLAPSDNVLIATRSLVPGERFTIDDVEVELQVDVPIGYKVARRSLSVGDAAVRFGMPIGHMTRAAAPGELIHSHNLASDYLAATRRLGDEN